MKTRIILFLMAVSVCACSNHGEPVVQSGSLTLRFNNLLHTNLAYESARIPLVDGYQPSEILRVNGDTIADFTLTEYHFESVDNEIGKGERLVITGESVNPEYPFTKKVIATAYDDIPDLITTRVEYGNNGEHALLLNGWDNNRYIVRPPDDPAAEERFWSFQSASYRSRQDWILPVGDGFEQKNYQGMNASDYGGGTPVVDIWRPDAGLAAGHLETVPQLISLPVKSMGPERGVRLSVTFDTDSVSQMKYPHAITPGEPVSTFETFLTTHHGDYYRTLRKYRRILELKGVEFSEPPETAYEPIWCAWGYGRDFTLDKVINTLPKVKELGFDWAVLDDGWQIAEGDWRTNEKFADTSMKEFVDRIHDHGLKAKLWWAPLAADPGSRVHEDESDMLLVNREGDYQRITWWNSHYLNPALQSTKDYHTGLVRKFLEEWGFDGLKIDGQHLNQVPPDYGHESMKYPEESVEALPVFYKEIYNTAKSIQEDAVVEICPCGTSGSAFIMPYMNQSVSSDPLSSWQIRHKGKTYKAIMGEHAAYYGDHVELSDNRRDFASTVGVGGVIGTKFTWPASADPGGRHVLTDEKEALIKKWMAIYKQYMLPKGSYRGELYDIGFDKPEGHAIEKDGVMFYSFYEDSFEGTIELRGLERSTGYRVVNYETDEVIDSITGADPQVQVTFTDHLLLKAEPVESDG